MLYLLKTVEVVNKMAGKCKINGETTTWINVSLYCPYF